MQQDTQKAIDDMGESIRATLALAFDVTEDRISVLAHGAPVDPSKPDGKMGLTIGVALDGNDPPAEWMDLVRSIVAAGGKAAEAMGHGATTIRDVIPGRA